MTRISRKLEKYNNGNALPGNNANEGTSARTRPFTFEEIMLRRKNSKLGSEAKGEVGEPDKLKVNDNAKKVSDHIEHDGVDEEMERNSTRKQESISMKEGHLDRAKDKESSDAAYSVGKLDKDITDSTKEDKNERSGHRRSRNEDRSRDDFENESDKDKNTRVKGDKDTNHRHHRSRKVEQSIDDFENESGKDIKNRAKRVKNVKSNHQRNRSEEQSREHLENQSEKDIKNRAKEDKIEKRGHHRSRNEEHLRDDFENESNKDMKSKAKAKADKNEKLSHHRSRNEERSRDDIESKSDKDMKNNAKGDKNEKLSHHRSRNEERSRDDSENKSDRDMTKKAKEGKNEKLSHHRSRNEERSRDVFENEEKKHSGNRARKEKYADTEIRKYETENKRKQRTGGDEKNNFEVDVNAAKKHDSGKRYDVEAAGKKGRKKESSPSHYEEDRPKRRRSRSNEKRDRNRRSISVSPRAHKRTSYQEREHGESSLHSAKDRKQHSDIDRNRISSNVGYGNSHYQRHGGRGSRLGGYSPRKRRTEAAVKTPSPTIRSPERKNAGWDLPPTGTDISSAGSMLSNLQTPRQILSSSVNELPAAVPALSNSAMEKTVYEASLNTLSTSKNITAESIQLTQATQPMKQLYVENVPTSASDKSIINCLNNFFPSSYAHRIQGNPPCIRCSINKEKGQALVEFLTPEDATEALSFDGRLFSGSILKFRRPDDFVESATGVPKKPVAVVGAISDVIKDSPNKIFVGGISKVLSSNMVMEIASAFGALSGYRYKVSEDANEACAFLEYVDKSITLKACAGLNGMKLGGQVLTVVQATPHASAANTEEPPCYVTPDHAKPLLSKPTKVLKLKNVLNQEELSTLSGPEVEEVLEDVRLECARYGTIKSVNIVRNGSDSTTAPGEVTSQAIVRSSSQNTEDENNIKKIESAALKTDPNLVEKSRPESSNDVSETLVDGGGEAETNRPSHGETEQDSLDTDILTSHLDTDTNPQESLSLLDTTKDESSQTNKNSVDFSLGNNSSTVKEESKPEEASIELNDTSRRNSDTNKTNDGKQQVDVFEVGCVLVEYMKTEASSAAAHSLHGRVYGDRVVLVGYVDHDLYISRFSK